MLTKSLFRNIVFCYFSTVTLNLLKNITEQTGRQLGYYNLFSIILFNLKLIRDCPKNPPDRIIFYALEFRIWLYNIHIFGSL